MPNIGTVKGGFWGDLSSDFSVISGENPQKRQIARKFNINGLRAEREIAETVTGAAAGSAASATHKRVQARENSQGELGGSRTIETITDVSRNTTAADVTEVKEDILAYPHKPSTYPVNLDRNPRQYPGG